MDEKFSQLIEQLTADDDAVGALSQPQAEEAAATLMDGLRSMAAEVADADDPEEVVEAMEQARALLDRVRTHGAALAEVAAARADKVQKLLEDLPSDETPPETPEDDGDEDDEEEEPHAEEGSEVEVVVEKEPVAASAALTKVAARLPARFRPDPEEHYDHRTSLVASATGDRLDSVMAAQMAFDRHRSFASKGGLGREEIRLVRLSIEHERTMGTDPFTNYQMMVDAGKDAQREADRQVAEVAGTGKLPLVADGGFCAPGQPIYDFFDLGGDGGLLTLPSVGAPRGRVIVPTSPTIQDVFANVEWDAALADIFTEADDIAQETKPCYHIECPDTSEFVLDAYPVCLCFGNFLARAWPEFIQHAQTISLRVARHKVNASMIAQAIGFADTTGPYPGAVTGSVISGFLVAIGFYAASYRDRYRMDPGAALDLVVPQWVPDVYAADKVRRDATADFNASRAEFTAALTSRGLRPQFVHDWQTLTTPQVVDWPTFTDVLLFAPGTLVRLDGGTLDLGVVRDHTLNLSNNFCTFSESFDGMAKIGPEVQLIQNLPTCPTGETGDRVAFDCQGS